jgi:hypothetical protein
MLLHGKGVTSNSFFRLATSFEDPEKEISE